MKTINTGYKIAIVLLILWVGALVFVEPFRNVTACIYFANNDACEAAYGLRLFKEEKL